LSAVKCVDANLRGDAEKPFWVLKYNFPCLLNLPDMMSLFGMPWYLWEGGPKGEGILQDVKPLINGLYGRWAEAAHNRYACMMAIRNVQDCYNDVFQKDDDKQCHEPILEDDDDEVMVHVEDDNYLSTTMLEDDGYHLGKFR